MGIAFLTRGSGRETADVANKFLENNFPAAGVKELNKYLSICPKCHFVYQNLSVSYCMYCRVQVERFVKESVEDYFV